MENEAVPGLALDAADMCGGNLKAFYLKGGGSESDFRTDLSDAIAGAIQIMTEGIIGDAA